MTTTRQGRHSTKSHRSAQSPHAPYGNTGHSNESPTSSHASADYADTNTATSAGPTLPSTINGSAHGAPYQNNALAPGVIYQHGAQASHQSTSTEHPLPMQRFQAPSPYPYAEHNGYQPFTVSAYSTTSHQLQQEPQAPSSVRTPAATQTGYHNTNVVYHVPQHQPYGSTTLVSNRQAQEQALRGVGTQFYGHGTHNGRGGQ